MILWFEASAQLTIYVEAKEVPEYEDKPAGQVKDRNSIALDYQISEHIEGVVVSPAVRRHTVIGRSEPWHHARHDPHHCGDQSYAQPNLEQ